MSIARCSNFPILLLIASLTTFTHTSPAADTSTQPSNRTYDQIVRLSLVEGDVRISRGKEGEHATGDAWERAGVNLPIQTGFSLVTGRGRAEIELEDASTVYLGDNSVLIFTQITSTNGVPYTEPSLVSGTATLHVQTTFPGERFVLRTPTDGVTLPYPGKSHDVAGKPPINMKHGVYEPGGRKGDSVQHVAFNSSNPCQSNRRHTQGVPQTLFPTPPARRDTAP